MAKDKDEEKAVAPRGEVGLALGIAAENLLPADFEDTQAEAPKILYLQVRQKDLKGDKGKLVRSAGGIRAGKVDDLTYEDREKLLVTILGFRPGRVYFQNVGDAKPTCKSNDMINGSLPEAVINGKKVYGNCETCFFSKWGSAEHGRQKCREVRRIFVVDWSNERPAILTLSPGSLKNWITFANFVQDQARTLAKGDKQPFIFHLLQVEAVPSFRDKPADHYVIEWENPTALPKALQERMSKGRAAALEDFRKAAEAQEFDSEDFVGGAEPGQDPGSEAAPPF